MRFTCIEMLESRRLLSGEYLLVADASNDTVVRYDADSGAFIDRFIGRHSGGINQPYAVLFGPDGNGDGQRDLYVSAGLFIGTGQNRGVFRYDGISGEFIDVFTRGGDLQSVRGMVFGPDGNIYVADMLLTTPRQGRVARFDGVTGAFIDTFIPPRSGKLDDPILLTFTQTDPMTLAYSGAATASTGAQPGPLLQPIGTVNPTRFDGIFCSASDDDMAEILELSGAD